MKSKKLYSAQNYMQNPKNFTQQHMTAVENFHLVKRVMTVKHSVPNGAPRQFSHMNKGNRRPSLSS